jgi:monoamine oxidase
VQRSFLRGHFGRGADRYLRTLHPAVDEIPDPVGSEFSSWGTDPHETGWCLWRAGARSDEVIRAATQPVPGLELFVCGEAFSRAQGWVEGALESADRVASALIEGSPSAGRTRLAPIEADLA